MALRFLGRLQTLRRFRGVRIWVEDEFCWSSLSLGSPGMSAANTVVENGGRVVLLDKSSFCGGNSTKATSGINGAGRCLDNADSFEASAFADLRSFTLYVSGTKTQKAKGIPDNAEIFTQAWEQLGTGRLEWLECLGHHDSIMICFQVIAYQDTLKGGAKKPELAKSQVGRQLSITKGLRSGYWNPIDFYQPCLGARALEWWIDHGRFFRGCSATTAQQMWMLGLKLWWLWNQLAQISTIQH